MTTQSFFGLDATTFVLPEKTVFLQNRLYEDFYQIHFWHRWRNSDPVVIVTATLTGPLSTQHSTTSTVTGRRFLQKGADGPSTDPKTMLVVVTSFVWSYNNENNDLQLYPRTQHIRQQYHRPLYRLKRLVTSWLTLSRDDWNKCKEWTKTNQSRRVNQVYSMITDI